MRRLILLALVASLGAALQPTAAEALGVTRVLEGLGPLTHVAFAPGEPRRLYLVEQDGVIRVRVKGKLRPEPFLDLRDEVGAGDERGLFAVAFHPRYPETRLLYVHYTDTHGDTRVVEFRSNGARALPGTGRVLLALEQPYSNHNGGQLAFGPDSDLYLGLGDGGAAGDPGYRAQDLGVLFGKILRIDVDVPTAPWEIVAYGLRNPWRFSFDRVTGDLWVADVGQDAWEEVDVLPAGTAGLVNFGWNAFEGHERFSSRSPNPAGALLFPVAIYGHLQGNCAITGGFVYRGALVDGAKGRYFYGDYCSGAVWSLLPGTAGGAVQRREPFTLPELSSFGEGPRGELYLATGRGEVYRLSTG